MYLLGERSRHSRLRRHTQCEDTRVGSPSVRLPVGCENWTNCTKLAKLPPSSPHIRERDDAETVGLGELGASEAQKPHHVRNFSRTHPPNCGGGGTTALCRGGGGPARVVPAVTLIRGRLEL